MVISYPFLIIQVSLSTVTGECQRVSTSETTLMGMGLWARWAYLVHPHMLHDPARPLYVPTLPAPARTRTARARGGGRLFEEPLKHDTLWDVGWSAALPRLSQLIMVLAGCMLLSC